MDMEKAVRKLRQCSSWLNGRVGRISQKRAAVYAGILLLLSLIPLLWLGRYNVMCIDDFDYGVKVHDAWLATGSVGQAVRAAWQQNMENYRNWQGTYISCFLMALCPMNFRYDAAWIVPFLMIGMFASSTFVLGRHILHKWLGADKTGSCFVMFMLLFMFYQVMEAPFEGIYWYNGATHYVLMEAVWFFTLAAISAGVWTEKKSREIVLCGIAMILSVIVGGGNLVTALQAEILMALLVLYAALTNRRKIAVSFIPFVTGSIGFLFNTLAPGNALRSSADADEGYSAAAAVLLSFYHAVVFIIRWTTPFVILIWLMLLPVLWKLMKRSDRTFRHPVLVTAGAFCLLSAMFTPTLYAIGMVGLSRVDDIIQMVYYLCLIMVTAYWLGYFAHRKDKEAVSEEGVMEKGSATDRVKQGDREALQEEGDRLPAGETFGLFLEKTGSRMTAVCLLLVLTMWVCTADKNTYTSISALRSLVNGEGRIFYEEAMERHTLFEDESILEVEIRPYSSRPALFDFNDLTEDPGNWLNLAVTQYYHKTYVKIVEEAEAREAE